MGTQIRPAGGTSTDWAAFDRDSVPYQLVPGLQHAVNLYTVVGGQQGEATGRADKIAAAAGYELQWA